MNRDVFLGSWRQLRGRLKQAWGELSDDDLDRVAGDYDQLVGLVQERYGWERERVEEELNTYLSEVGAFE